MDLKNVVLNHINTFPEVDSLKEILESLPEDYTPFPGLTENLKIGAMLFAGAVCLSPISFSKMPYEGAINLPSGCSDGQAFLKEGTQGVEIGATFKYYGKEFIIHRTDIKHKHP
jgi:hypothetical protein